MTNEELQYRASEARRLLNEPLLKEALGYVEETSVNELLLIRGAEPEDDRKRRALIDTVAAIRSVAGFLSQAIEEGKSAANRAAQRY